jgi:sugar fermentation stimulation protein A
MPNLYPFIEPFKPAKFIQRINRFVALVDIDGEAERIFVPNTGRMRELLTPDAKVLLTYHDLPHRSTNYDLALVWYNQRWVSLDSRLPNILFKFWWEQGCLCPFNEYNHLKKEVTFQHSRLDFRLTNPAGDCYVEVKSVTLVEDGVAMFPDAPTERGSRHLLDLTKTKEIGAAGAVVFIIQRDDAEVFKPHDATDPLFGKNLRKAVAEGVKAYALKCSITEEGISFLGEIPVILGDEIER